MAGQLKNFHPDEVLSTWSIRGGATIDMTEGLVDAAGAMKETKDGALYTRRTDRQSNMVRNRVSKKGGSVLYTYTAEAPIHDVYSALILADEETGAVVGDIVIKDLQGTSLFMFVSAFIEDGPSMGYGDTADDRPYVFGYAKRQVFFGGSTVR